jgi:sugar phosphate permease
VGKVNETAGHTGAASKGLRERWLFLLPAVFVTYSLAYLDRTNYGFGAAAGLAATLHITSSQSALLGSLFFLGYFVFQMPGVAYARRRSASRLIFFSLLMWGALAALTGVIHNFWLLAVDRLLLGVAESLIFPAMLLLLTQWFTRAERSRANTILILGNPITVLWMSAITGYLIHAFGWQMTFVIEGIPSILWAFVWVMVVRDKPEQAKWMSAEASDYLNSKLAEEQLALPKVKGVGKALVRPDVMLLAVQYFCWNIGQYGFILWLPTIIRAGSSAGIEATGLLSAMPYLLAVMTMMTVSYLSDKSLQRRGLVWPFLILAGVAMMGSYVFAAHGFWISYGCLILAGGAMYAPYGPFFAIIPELVPRNVTAEVMAMVNSAGALGAFVGAWLVGELQARTGNSRAGFLLMSVSLIVSGLIMLLGLRGSGSPSAVDSRIVMGQTGSAPLEASQNQIS